MEGVLVIVGLDVTDGCPGRFLKKDKNTPRKCWKAVDGILL